MRESSVVKVVDSLLNKAIAQAASDIHLETAEQALRVRYRLDGILYDQDPIDHSLMAAVISRVKVLANINIAERRIPQDGKFRIVVKKVPIDLRVSTFPSLYGEKIVIRILDRSINMIELDKLGFSKEMLHAFISLLNQTHGFFLVTGPTGSGKTTTLYSALSVLNSVEKNIITLEDPVEFTVDGVTQGQIHPEAGFTFEKGMRALLRQDPDIVMVGEIRDKQTAQIAIEAALTGHIVLSTVHTNDSVSVIMRLMDMGIEPFLINAAISGILAQRLVRKICPTCRIAVKPTDEEHAVLEKIGIDCSTLYRGKGCNDCFNLGYRGRVGIFELLSMTNALRSLIVQNPSIDALYKQASADGLKTLLFDGAQKVVDGVITLQELMRVIS